MYRIEASLALAQQNPGYFNQRIEKRPETNTAKEIHSENFFERLRAAFVNALAHLARGFAQGKPAPIATPAPIAAPIQVPKNRLAEFSSLEGAQRQVSLDLVRSIRFEIDGKMVAADKHPEAIVSDMESHFHEKKVSEEEQKSIFNMLHQALFATAYKTMHPEDEQIVAHPNDYPEEQFNAASRRIALDQGFPLPISIAGENYTYSPTQTTGYSVDTQAKTVTGHRLIEVNQELVGVRGAPRSFYQRVTYHYETNTLLVERLSVDAFPQQFRPAL